MTSKKSPQVTPKPTQKSRKIKPLKSKEPRTPKELAPELKEKLLSATIENHEDLHFITPKRLDQLNVISEVPAYTVSTRIVDMKKASKEDLAALPRLQLAFGHMVNHFANELEKKEYRAYLSGSFTKFRDHLKKNHKIPVGELCLHFCYCALQKAFEMQKSSWRLAQESAKSDLMSKPIWSKTSPVQDGEAGSHSNLPRSDDSSRKSGSSSESLKKAAPSAPAVFTADEKEFMLRLLNELNKSFWQLMDGGDIAPKPGEKVRDHKKLCTFIRHLIREHRGNPPRLRNPQNAEVWFDDCTYNFAVVNGAEFFDLTQLRKDENDDPPRLHIPLLGIGPNALRKGSGSGTYKRPTIRMSGSPETGYRFTVQHKLDEKHRRFSPALKKLNEEMAKSGLLRIVALDLGFSEVFTDDDGNRYGTRRERQVTQRGVTKTCVDPSLGDLLIKRSKILYDAGRGRGPLQARARNCTDKVVARRIERCCLSNGTLRKELHANEEAIDSLINHAVNELIKRNPANVYVVERFGEFSYESIPVRVRRWLSGWVRGKIIDALKLKGALFGFEVVEVNCAYTSQRCPVCAHVERANRNGDSFKCRNEHCEAAFDADQVAAFNLLRRAHDTRFDGFLTKESVYKLEREDYEVWCRDHDLPIRPDPKLVKREAKPARKVLRGKKASPEELAELLSWADNRGRRHA